MARVHMAILHTMAGAPSLAREEASGVVDQPSTPPALCAHALAILAEAGVRAGHTEWSRPAEADYAGEAVIVIAPARWIAWSYWD